MKLGLVARADNSGLGVQTLEFYKNMQPAKTMVVDIGKLNGNKSYPERYPDAQYIQGFPTPNDIESFLEGLDVVFIAESAYTPYLYTRAAELGVKTAVQYNYEFFDWFVGNTPVPDMLIAPSRWHYAEVDAFVNDLNARTGSKVKHCYLHCPVNREALPKREISAARTFLHVAGRSAAHDRNGTETVIDASRFLKSAAQIVIHFQGEQGLPHQATSSIADYAQRLAANGDEEKVTIEQIDFKDYHEVYTQGDVLLLPRRYGGNCLPLNEALSTGMPAIMTDISPNDQFLPKGWLLPATIVNQFTPRTTVTVYGSDPKALAAKIDWFYDMIPPEFREQSAQAEKIADCISWAKMKPKYLKAFEELCTP